MTSEPRPGTAVDPDMSRWVFLWGAGLGLLSALALYQYATSGRAPSAGRIDGTSAAYAAPQPGLPSPVDPEIRLPDAIAEPVGVEEAPALTAWWAGQNSHAVSIFQRFHAYGLTEGWRLRVMHAHGGGYLVRFMDGETIRGSAWFMPDLHLREADGAERRGGATAISAAEVAAVTLACWRLLRVDAGVLQGMWDDFPPLPADAWSRECGNWVGETSVTDSAEVHAGGSGKSGRHVVVSIGDDGVVRACSLSRWGSRGSGSRRICRVLSYGHTRMSDDEAAEPSPPVANN